MRTAARLCHAGSVVWLCAPRRCDKAWALLEAALPEHFGSCELVTDALHAAVPAAARLEVELWRCSDVKGAAEAVAAAPLPDGEKITIHPAPPAERRRSKKEKKRKRSREADAE